MGAQVGATVVRFCAILLVAHFLTDVQAAPLCPYPGRLPDKACSHNPRPHSMLAELGGSVLNSAECSKDMVEAFASLYAYNDGACYADGSIDVQSLKYIDDPNNALSYFERNDKEHSFKGSVFCNLESNTIILSFRGSADLYQPQSQNWYPDWETNVVAHLGPLPLQYQHAFNAADQIKARWRSGAFDNVCGQGKPSLMLTGHSKGGAEAQLSAVGLELPAIVFNSDWINKSHFSAVPPPNITPIKSNHPTDCVPSDNAVLKNYLESGAMKDVRMVNDPLVKWLHDTFGCRLPHANVDWLIDTLSCSADDGHSMETIVRELKVCANSAQPPANKSP